MSVLLCVPAKLVFESLLSKKCNDEIGHQLETFVPILLVYLVLIYNAQYSVLIPTIVNIE